MDGFELNKLFITEVLELKIELVKGYGYWVFLDDNYSYIANEKVDAGRRYIASSWFSPCADRNIAQLGIPKCPGLLFFNTVIKLVADRYSKANNFKIEPRAQDYIQANCNEIVAACVWSKRQQ